MNKDEVLKLAGLARIDVSDEEAEALTHEFEDILKYVSEVKSVEYSDTTKSREDYPVRNVMREDEGPHESGKYTENILSQAPSREGEYVKVKQILN